MFRYIYRDMMSMVKHLPYGFALGLVVVPLLFWATGRRGEPEGDAGEGLEERRRGEGIFSRIFLRIPVRIRSKLPVAGFGLYLSTVLVITFLSRENGISRGMDLRLFSTWGINRRNNAFVVENVLLFLPYGFLGCLAFRRLRGFLRCLAFGAATSLCIETLQLITGRGYFQIDDILTNTLGAAAGFLVFRLLVPFGRRLRR